MPRHKPLPRPLRRKKELRNLKNRLLLKDDEINKQKELIKKYQDKIRSLQNELRISYNKRKDKIVPYKAKSVYRDEVGNNLKVIYRIKNRTDIFGIDVFFINYYNAVKDALLNAYNVLGSFKVEGSMKVLAKSMRSNEVREIFLFTQMYTIMAVNEINNNGNHSDRFAQDLRNDFKRARLTSDMKIIKIFWFEMDCVEYRPLNGGSYITSPYASKSLVNIKNDDDLCFKYCITAYFILKQKPNMTNKSRAGNYTKFLDSFEVNYTGITFPVTLNQISLFEKNNPSISICVYDRTRVEQKPTLIYQTINNSAKNHFIPLLLVTNAHTSHYILIRKFNAFMCIDKLGGRYYCHLCFATYHVQKDLDVHLTNIHTEDDKPLQMELPSPPNHLMKFVSYNKMVKHPFVMVADIECSQVKPQKYYSQSANTTALAEHIPSGLGYYYNSIANTTGSCYHYFNENPIVNFVNAIEKYATEIYDIFKNPKPIPILSPNHPYFTATRCNYCNEPFNENSFNYRKVLDHDHITGLYRCAAHSVCNLHVQLKKRLVVFFHNGSQYDWHLLIEEFSKRKYKIEPISQTDEKYLSVSVYIKFGPTKHNQVEIRFLDSYKFLSKSLDDLVSILGKSNLKILAEFYPNQNDFNLLCRKGIYPYQWQTSFDKLVATKEIPPISEFYSSLTDSTVSEEDYNYARLVYNHFKCESMLDYHNLYLKTDVLLLADIINNFRDFSLETYGLDPAYYFTAPNLSLDACLKYTNQTLELITKGNEDMYLLFEKAIRGGISGVGSKRYSTAEEGKHLMYWDANNMYGHSMIQPQPTGNFKWIRKNETDLEDTIKLLQECYTLYKQNKPITKGYLIQTDLYYPKELHKKHNDLPLAPENIVVQKAYLSPAQQEIFTDSDLNTKLTTNLFNKSKYITFHENLFYYLDEGLKIGTIYNVIQFDQSAWMKPYIELNTKLRMSAKNDFQKEFYKYMNVSVYGKTMENVRKYKDLTICTSPKEFRWHVRKHNYAGSRMLTDSSVIVELQQTKKKFNKPIYIGAKILDLSKLHMYQFWYNNLKQKYDNKISLLYMDCDSVIAEVYTENIYLDMLNDKDTYDTSDFPKEHFLYSDKNKKVLGKFKDVLNGVKLQSFIALRSKCYAYVTEDDITNAKINGVKKHVANLISFQQYVDVLFGDEKNHTVTQNTIRSKNHHLYTVSQVKAGLRYGDIKRYDLDPVNTLALGHYSIGSTIAYPTTTI